MFNKTIATLAILSTAAVASADLVGVESFSGTDAGDNNLGPSQFLGPSLSSGGTTLQSQLNGVAGSQLAYAGDRVISAGLGVGQPAADGPSVGFTRSINNNATDSESIAMTLSAGDGLGALYTSNAASGVPSIVTVSGFSADPMASSSDGAVAYANGAVTWTVASQSGMNADFSGLVSVLSFGDLSASDGATLVFGNGTAVTEGNEYGLRGFDISAVPEPTSLALLGIGGLALVRRRR